MFGRRVARRPPVERFDRRAALIADDGTFHGIESHQLPRRKRRLPDPKIFHIRFWTLLVAELKRVKQRLKSTSVLSRRYGWIVQLLQDEERRIVLIVAVLLAL